MLAKTNKDINLLINWFNYLEPNDQVIILDYIHDKTDKLLLSDEYLDELSKLIDTIELIIIKNGDEEEKIVNLLIDSGLDKIFAKGFYNFCVETAAPYLDAKVISKMPKTNLEKLCSFVLNKIILFREYEETVFIDFMKLVGFQNDEKSARRSLRIIRILYSEVSNRKYSPETLKIKLEHKYKIKKDRIDIIVNPLIENIPEIYHANLLNQVNKLLSDISSFSSTTELIDQ